MILQSLVRLAEQENLPQDFEPRQIAWIVDIDQEGNIFGVMSTRQNSEGPNKGALLSDFVPNRRPGRTSLKVVPDYLVDNAKYCFGISSSTDKKGDQPDHLRRIRESHREHLEEIIAQNGDEGAKAQLACVRRIETDPATFSRIWCGQDEKPLEVTDPEGRTIKVPSTWKPNDLFTFSLEGEWICHRQGVKDYLDWKRKQQEGPRVFCLVCGQRRPMARLHRYIRGLPGPNTQGAPLVSFNADAFMSYGFSRNENAPVCERCMNFYATALNRLSDRRGYLHPTKAGETLPVGNVTLSSDTAVVFWSLEKKEISMSFLEGLLSAETTKDDAVRALYGSPWKGHEIVFDDPTQFYTLVFTSAKSRIILRTVEMTTLGAVAQSFRRHFDDLVVSPDWRERYNSIALPSLLEAIRPPGDEAYTPPHLVALMFQSALTGKPYPQEILTGALRRIKAEAGREREKEPKNRKEGVSARRIALVKAYLNRLYRHSSPPLQFSFKELTPDMDNENTTPAYRLGRLFAVLEKIQQEATDAKAGIADRFIGAASTTPALVFGRLWTLHHHHLSKLKEGRAVHFGKLIDEILSPLPGELPKTLRLEEQGVFMVGYHHQRAELWKKKDDGAQTNSDDQGRN